MTQLQIYNMNIVLLWFTVEKDQTEELVLLKLYLLVNLFVCLSGLY